VQHVLNCKILWRSNGILSNVFSQSIST
jgi:hypothetical protein